MLESFIPEKYRKNLFRRSSTSVSSKQKKQSVSVKGAAPSLSFEDAVDNQAQEKFNQDIDSFVEDLNLLEKELLDRPSEQSVMKYRSAVSEFLKKTSKNYAAFKFYKRRMSGSTELKIWNVVDQKLEDLYRGVMSKQLKGMMLLDELHSIKGLIVDLKIG